MSPQLVAPSQFRTYAQGMLGCGASMQKSGPGVSNNVVGAGKSTQFRLPALDSATTLCLFFEITAEAKAAEKAKAGEVFTLQFSTKYLHWDSSWRRRITTLSRRWVTGQQPHEVMLGFDQEAAAVMMARFCTWKMESEEDFDATRWIDRALIRLCQRCALSLRISAPARTLVCIRACRCYAKSTMHVHECSFGQGNKDDPKSFSLLPEMTFYPGFMFHLRRSQFVQVFGNSPDETAFARLMLFKEHVQPAVTMIQPQLIRYALDEPPQPAMVDISSIVPDHILFMDAYFYIVVYHGDKIAAWRAEGCALLLALAFAADLPVWGTGKADGGGACAGTRTSRSTPRSPSCCALHRTRRWRWCGRASRCRALSTPITSLSLAAASRASCWSS